MNMHQHNAKYVNTGSVANSLHVIAFQYVESSHLPCSSSWPDRAPSDSSFAESTQARTTCWRILKVNSRSQWRSCPDDQFNLSATLEDFNFSTALACTSSHPMNPLIHPISHHYIIPKTASTSSPIHQQQRIWFERNAAVH
jgi:hypothetical protein